MLLNSYLFHLKARNLSPRTVKAASEYISLFIRVSDPLTATKRDLEVFLSGKSETCRPSTVQTYWRYLKGFFEWLTNEGDITVNPMAGVPKPMVPPIDITVLSATEVHQLLDTCKGKGAENRRDLALLTIMLDTGLRLTEVTNLKMEDVSESRTLRVFGKGRKWRTVALGETSSTALNRWLRTRGDAPGSLWIGRRGELTPNGIRLVVRRRGKLIGMRVHPHMLRHTFVDNWLRNGGNEVDLSRLAGWTLGSGMPSRYAQNRAAERALTAHKTIAPLDRL
jgi:site-specific recombinase XerD